MVAPDCYVLYFDGASRSNPHGPAAYGWILYLRRGLRWRLIKQGSLYLGRNVTSNQAEYQGLIAGLEAAHRRMLNVDNDHRKKVVIRGDSELIIRQMMGEYQVRSDNLTALYSKATSALSDLEEHATVKFQHVKRAKNKTADHLANQAIEEGLGKANQ